MSIARACYVVCDNCGDPAPVSTDDANNARAQARREGYRRERVGGAMVDLCPTCRGTSILDGRRLRGWNYAMREERPAP